MKSIKEVEKIIVKKEVDKVFCDVCGKEINTNEIYFNVKTHHRDWGNDSIDSYEDYEICSYKCLLEHQKEWLEEYKNSNTACYEIEKEIGKGYVKNDN